MRIIVNEREILEEHEIERVRARETVRKKERENRCSHFLPISILSQLSESFCQFFFHSKMEKVAKRSRQLLDR